MAQYSTDFSGDTVGQQPAGWTKRFSTARDWVVASDATVASGKVLRLSAGASDSHAALTLDAIDADPNKGEVSQFLRVRAPSGATSAAVFAMTRGSGLAGSENYVSQGLRIHNSTRGVDVVEAGVRSAVYDSGSQSFPNDGTIFNVATEARGGSFTIKVWADGDVEPEYPASRTDSSSLPSGWVGLVTRTLGEVDVLYFAAGTGLDDAPRAPAPPPTASATIDAPMTPGGTSVLTYSDFDAAPTGTVTATPLDSNGDPVTGFTPLTYTGTVADTDTAGVHSGTVTVNWPALVDGETTLPFGANNVRLSITS